MSDPQDVRKDPSHAPCQPTGEARVLVQGLRDAVPYIREHEGHVFVVTFGGEALDDPATFERLIRDIVLIADLDRGSGGTVLVNQQSLFDLQSKLQSDDH